MILIPNEMINEPRLPSELVIASYVHSGSTILIPPVINTGIPEQPADI